MRVGSKRRRAPTPADEDEEDLLHHGVSCDLQARLLSLEPGQTKRGGFVFLVDQSLSTVQIS